MTSERRYAIPGKGDGAEWWTCLSFPQERFLSLTSFSTSSPLVFLSCLLSLSPLSLKEESP